MIIEYWFRTLIVSSFSVDDITNIMLEFGKEIEKFERKFVNEHIMIDNNGRTLSKTQHAGGSTISGFGQFTAVPGGKYHWKLKIMSNEYDGNKMPNANIGIVKANKYEKSMKGGWFETDYGYSYYIWNGKIYHNGNGGCDYGQKIIDNEIIDIWLDLEDNYTVSWGKNGNKFKKGFDVIKETNYKLAIGFRRGKAELLSFEIIE